jgi:hypothetical protein
MGVIGDNILMCFPTVTKLVQALAITYDEIFQALAVAADFLLPKPFLDPGFDGVVRWTSPVSEIFSQLVKHVKVQGGPQSGLYGGWGGGSINGLGIRMSHSSAARASKISRSLLTSP